MEPLRRPFGWSNQPCKGLSGSIAFVLFDEPRRNKSESLENFGGNTAAPTFSRIIKKIAPILNRSNYIKIE